MSKELDDWNKNLFNEIQRGKELAQKIKENAYKILEEEKKKINKEDTDM